MAETGAEDWNMRSIWPDTLSSVRFLSRLPVAVGREGDIPDFTRSSYSFPLAGLIIALPSASCLIVGDLIGLPDLVVAILSVVTMVTITGALHEDGLADVADGFWGSHTKQGKLEIMRDSAIGTYGTLALVFSVFVRIALVAALLGEFGGLAAAGAFLAVASLSRTGILMVWSALPSAREADGKKASLSASKKNVESLAVRYGHPNKIMDIRLAILTLPALALAIWFVGSLPFVTAMGFWAFALFFVTRLAQKHIGGHTGDVLGATQQISELGLYLGLVIAI